MKSNKQNPFYLLLAAALLLAACTPQAAASPQALPADQSLGTTENVSAPLVHADETEQTAAASQKITLPGDEQISFQLPQGWKHFGNDQFFSPDEGKTLLNLTGMPLEGGMIEALMPANAETQRDEPVLVGDGVQANLYHLKVFANDGKSELKGYEALYTFVDPYGKQMIAMGLLAPTEAELAALEPVLLLAVESFSMAAPEPPTSGYETIHEPGPGEVSYELPYQWKQWGNAGLFSPDDGSTLIGLRRVWAEPGKEVGTLLLTQGAQVLSQETVSVQGMELVRYEVEVYDMLNVQPGEQAPLAGYEAVYMMPSPDGEQLLGFALRAATLEELQAQAPVVEHMIETFQMADE